MGDWGTDAESGQRMDAFLRGIDLQPEGDDRYSVAAPEGGARVFGGMLLAPAVRAASRATELPFLHSLHAHFLRPAEPGAGLDLAVTRLRDSRSFATRRVAVSQAGKLVFEATLDFFAGGDGLSHLSATMPAVAGPEELPEDWEREGLASRAEWYPGNANEVRSVAGWPRPEAQGRVVRMHWTRPAAPLPDEADIHAAAMAAATDYSLGLSVVHFHGRTPGTQASMSHALFFHAEPRYDDWHLYVVESDVARRGLAVVRGTLWRRDGAPVATAVQECLYR